MTKQVVYRKVNVSESPKKGGNYHCIFFGGTDYESMCTVQYDKKFGFHEEFTDCTGITHWLKAVELPSEIEITEWVKGHAYYGHCTQEYHEGLEEGARYLLDKIFK